MTPVLSAPESEVWVDAPGMPFDGLTAAKAKVINDALIGRRVLVAGGTNHRQPEEFMFHTIVMAGRYMASDMLFTGVGDLRLARYDRDGGYASLGSIWNVSAVLVELFMVVEAPELCPCQQCGAWFPQSRLRDTVIVGEPWEPWQSFLECDLCVTRC